MTCINSTQNALITSNSDLDKPILMYKQIKQRFFSSFRKLIFCPITQKIDS